MRDNIYVGVLISERKLEHSSGPWKKHKYLKKIGDKYIYAKNKIASAIDDVKTAIKENPNASEYYKRATQAETSKDNEVWSEGQTKERAKKSALEEGNGELFKRLSEHDRTQAFAYRVEGQANRKKYNKTLSGKVHNAAESVSRKLSYKERRSNSAKDLNNRAKDKERDSTHSKNLAAMYKDHINNRTNVPGENRSLHNYYRNKTESDKRASNALKRVSAARQSEIERKSIKQRSERAKKRVVQALARFKKRK